MMRNLVIFLAVIIAGCAAPAVPTHQVRAAWDPAHAARLLEPGANTIQGDALWRQQGGSVVTCAGNPVALVPATAYATERVQTLYRSTEKGASTRRYLFLPDPPDYMQLMRVTHCNAQGNFEFANVADGDFFVVTTVQWIANESPQGGSLMHRTQVRGGETATLVLSVY